MVRASTASGELPESLFIREKVVFGETPIAWGGFASVYQGNYKGDTVAVKRLHLSTTSAGEKAIAHGVRGSHSMNVVLTD
jgi:hypothetical protein